MMVPLLNTLRRAAVAGMLCGALVLGVGGRILMRLIAIATHGSPGFSFGGSLEVLAAGAFFGLLGGLMQPFVPRKLSRLRVGVHTIALFVLIAAMSDAARGAVSTIPRPARLPALVACFGLLLVYALAVNFSIARLGGVEAGTTRTTGPQAH